MKRFRRHAYHQEPRETRVLTTENSPLFGSLSGADILRSRCGTHSDHSVLQIAASAANLSFTEAPIWGISDELAASLRAAVYFNLEKQK
jgi:hypothetical protein